MVMVLGAWTALSCVGLLAASTLTRAASRADDASHQWAREASVQRGLRMLPGEAQDAAAAPGDEVVGLPDDERSRPRRQVG